MSARFNMPDKSNIQGFILKGYGHNYSCHLLLTFPKNNETSIKAFIGDLYPKVQSADPWKEKPESLLNIGLTYNGIKKIGTAAVAPTDLENFPISFKEGPWMGGSQASLGDVYPLNGKTSPSHPKYWWNANAESGSTNENNTNLDCIIHAYGITAEALETLVTDIMNSAAKHKLTEIIPLENGKRLYQTEVENDPHKIHFGYTDGISQPALQNPGTSSFRTTPEDINSFLVGYYTGAVSMPGPVDSSSSGTFAKDGTYNAFRVLYQDVASFNKLLKNQADKHAGLVEKLNLKDKAELEEWFAAKLCGRWRNGSPMITNPEHQSANIEGAIHDEDFGYTVLDNLPPRSVAKLTDAVPSSKSCPFSSHTRVTNTRNQQLKASEGEISSPRIIRRGVPYGKPLEVGSTNEDMEDRGLIGLFFCGSLTLQFEKISGWMNNNNFSDSPIFSIENPPQDALLGNRAIESYSGVVDTFDIPLESGETITIENLPPLLITRGTAYCFLPSMKSLANIAGME
ncbi:MAG: hypothetical protein JKY02_00690 [Flavobacteriaceae bacterium]|nr:hypothetical protein [Flavobacteriaceae bacterium]